MLADPQCLSSTSLSQIARLFARRSGGDKDINVNRLSYCFKIRRCLDDPGIICGLAVSLQEDSQY